MQRSAVTATDNCPVRRQFNASRSLRQVALQSIWLFQESLIQRVGASLDTLDSVASFAALQVEILQERRSALISAAVTGQIDVRGLVPDVSE
jgi:type I restriction enzyme S subunit